MQLLFVHAYLRECRTAVKQLLSSSPVTWINRKGGRPTGAARPDREFRTLTELADWLA
jgi:hypothetical protein